MLLGNVLLHLNVNVLLKVIFSHYIDIIILVRDQFLLEANKNFFTKLVT